PDQIVACGGPAVRQVLFPRHTVLLWATPVEPVRGEQSERKTEEGESREKQSEAGSRSHGEVPLIVRCLFPLSGIGMMEQPSFYVFRVTFSLFFPISSRSGAGRRETPGPRRRETKARRGWRGRFGPQDRGGDTSRSPLSESVLPRCAARKSLLID